MEFQGPDLSQIVGMTGFILSAAVIILAIIVKRGMARDRFGHPPVGGIDAKKSGAHT